VIRRQTMTTAICTSIIVLALMTPLTAGSGWADTNSTVYLCRTERILLPPGWTAPSSLYPQGRVDARQVTGLLDTAIRAYTGKSNALDNPWREIATPQDKVGIQVDLLTPPVTQETINAVIDGLVNSGVSPDNIIVYTGHEAELFAAGISVNPIGRGIRTMGSESEGYRGGLSRIVLDYCTVIINIARLKADRELGMRGCLTNCLTVVPYVERLKLIANPTELPTAAAHPLMRQKVRLHILEAYQPLLEDTGEQLPPIWEYRGLLLSSDPVALDRIGLTILATKQKETWGATQEEPPRIPADRSLKYLEAAANRKYRLGRYDLSQIEVKVSGVEHDLLLDRASTHQE
jgi:uncharacterized protein (DUF362 family)